MDVRFEDHPAFQRASLLAAAGGAAFGAVGPLPLAVVGSAAALTLGTTAVPWRWRVLAACACAASAFAWQLAPRPWSAPACGAMLALALAAVRADGLKRADARPLSRAAVALAALAGSAVLWAASALLPDLTVALATIVPPFIAAGFSGAVLGLWTAFASVPLHLRIGGDPAGNAKPARSELRACMALTSAALELAARAAELDEIRRHLPRQAPAVEETGAPPPAGAART